MRKQHETSRNVNPERSVKQSLQFVSKVAKAVHQTATDFHQAGVMTGQTLKQFDGLCLKKGLDWVA